MFAIRGIALSLVVCVPSVVLAADQPTYVAIVDADSASIVGELGRENDEQIELIDLSTGEATHYVKAELKSLRKDLSEKAVIDRVGLPVFMARRVEQVWPEGAVAILPIPDLEGGESDATRRLEAELTRALVKRGVTVVARNRPDATDEDIALKKGETLDAEKVQMIGKQIGAAALIVGSTSVRGKLLETQLRLVRVDTGEVTLAVTHAGKDEQAAAENLEIRSRRTATMIVGQFDVVWEEGRTGKRGTIVYTFEPNGTVWKDRAKVGTWTAEGDAVAVDYFDPARGRVAIEPSDRTTFTGIHTWANGDRSSWVGTRKD